MRAVIHLDPDVAEQPLAGRTVRAHLSAVLTQAGFDVVSEAPYAFALHVDGRFAAVSASTFARLRLPGDAASTPDGVTVAAVVHSLDELRAATGEPLRVQECHDVCVRAGLARAERVVRQRVAEQLEDAGVHVVDPGRTLVDATVEVAPSAILWPDVVLRGRTRVLAGAEIRPGCWIEDSTVCERAVVKPHCVCDNAWIGPDSTVGPMAHLRPGARLVGENKVGNFVEVKKATLERGAKSSHLTYLGDAEIGEGANIGAGTITCNYDGHRKHRTEIGAGAFIGSNTALVAPITVGDGAIVGAGSTLTRDVPADALAVVRGTTKILEGKGKALNERNARLKARAQAKARDAE